SVRRNSSPFRARGLVDGRLTGRHPPHTFREGMAFSPEYIRTVLNDNFEDAKRLFLDPLLAIHAAHLVMLAETGIVGMAEARRIRDALAAIDRAEVAAAAYDGS